MLLLDPNEPLFIIGDLNMDLKSLKGFDLAQFLIRQDLKNHINEHTRVCRNYFKDKKKFITSKSCIDTFIHNQDKVVETKVIPCPFSDHKFIIAALDFNKTKNIPFVNEGRSLSEKNLFLISDLIKSQDFSFDTNNKDIDKIWNEHRLKILECVDTVAPIKTFKQRPQEIAPWVDEKLIAKRQIRD